MPNPRNNDRVDQSAHNDNLPHFAVSPGSVPEPDVPEHRTPPEVPHHQPPPELPEHQVQAGSADAGPPQQQRPHPEPQIPERKNEPDREAPPREDQDMNKRMQDQRDDPAEGQILH